mgnify:CR=1 FL=1
MNSNAEKNLFRLPAPLLAAIAGATGVLGFEPVGFFPVTIGALALLSVWRVFATLLHLCAIAGILLIFSPLWGLVADPTASIQSGLTAPAIIHLVGGLCVTALSLSPLL